MPERIHVLFADYQEIPKIAKALNSPLRRRMLSLLHGTEMSVSQIAQALKIPQSTCTVNVQALEDARLIATRQQNCKYCSSHLEEVILPLVVSEEKEKSQIELELPLGLYIVAEVHPPCGIASHSKIIGYTDMPEYFLDPQRAHAELIWFTRGYLEYMFPWRLPAGKEIRHVSFSAEVCSEFPGYNETWPSDITVWFNGTEIGTWTSPGDMGARRGRFTPSWWPDASTQYGFMKTWMVNDEGSFIDGVRVSDVTLSDISIQTNTVSLRIGVKDDAVNCGGMNIFGTQFGNHNSNPTVWVGLG